MDMGQGGASGEVQGGELVSYWVCVSVSAATNCGLQNLKVMLWKMRLEGNGSRD